MAEGQIQKKYPIARMFVQKIRPPALFFCVEVKCSCIYINNGEVAK